MGSKKRELIRFEFFDTGVTKYVVPPCDRSTWGTALIEWPKQHGRSYRATWIKRLPRGLPADQLVRL